MTEKKEDFSRNKRYSNIKLSLSIVNIVINIIYYIILVFAGASVLFRDTVEGIVQNSYFGLLLFALITGAIQGVLTSGTSFYSGFILEHKYGLSNQTFFQWLKEEIKGMVVGTVIIIPLMLLFYFILLNYPGIWWFYTALAMFLFSILLTQLAPVLLFPIFYKFKPLENDELKEKMTDLLTKADLKIKGIYSFDMSKETKKANAALAGLGKTRRVILGDNLLENFSTEEITSVFAHEVGHHKHKHLFKQILVGGVFLFCTLYVTSLIYNIVILRMGFNGLADLAALPALSLIWMILGLFLNPLQNLLSQYFEFEADRYACSYSGGKAFSGALARLRDMNLADPDPHPFISIMFHSHPSISRRIKLAEK